MPTKPRARARARAHGSLRLVAFDLDGTLIDSRRDLATATNLVLATLGLPERGADEIAGFIGHGVHQLLRSALGPAEEHRLEDALSLFRPTYARYLVETTRVYDEVRPVLAALRARGLSLVLGVATNKPQVFSERILERLGIRYLFRHVVAADSEGVRGRKPDPSMLELLRQRARVDVDEMSYVGDMDVDVETARAAGCRVAVVAWGFAGGNVTGADLVAKTGEDLLTWLLGEDGSK